jgi:hypothetical protein
MKTKSMWTSGNRIDSIMNVLVIVLALGMLGLGAWEAEPNSVQAASSNIQRVLSATATDVRSGNGRSGA